jgi:phospholipase C
MTSPQVGSRPDADPQAHPKPLDRRSFLRKSAMAVAGGTLFSCTGGRIIPRVSPASSPAARADTRWPIKNVIYLMLENRSFDNLFGRFPGVDGTQVGNMLGADKPLLSCPDWLPGDLPHDRVSALGEYNGGKLDNFGIGDYGDPFAYTQFRGPEIPAYWQWARDYALSDHFFASVMGPSYPNHFFFIAGRSDGVSDNPENIGTTVDPATEGKPGGGRFKSWGCDAVGQGTEHVYVEVVEPNGKITRHEPCFRFPTVGQQLTKHEIDWAYYAPLPGYLGYMWNAYNGIDEVFHSDLWQEHAQHNIDDLVNDIKANRLPSVTWAVPHFELSDHPPSSSAFTHNWVMDIVNAVMQGDMWEHTAIFLTWDEWGGFYDHVAPPQIDGLGLGFRVPLLTISPYTPKGLIDDELGEFSTPLRFISDNWGIPPLSPRIAASHNMEHLFDFKANAQAPRVAIERAKTFGNPYTFPQHFPDWPPGTVPVESPFG